MSFSFKPAIRSKVSMLVGMIGGTGSGKTYSAMRLASGLANGEKFAVIDTEAGRALHYADQFNFDHGDLAPPFRPDAYIQAIMEADKAGYPVIVVDSTSHVWAGDGGILDWQEEELERMAGDDWKKREAVKMASWIRPKMSHKQMVQRLLQVRAHLILCFRAEEKIEMVREDGKMKIVPKVTLTGLDGWVPICEKSLPFELTASFLLLAKEPGIPHPIKLQEQHRPLFDLTKPITEESGKRLGEWAAGEPSVDNSSELRTLLKAAKIPEADFLAAARRTSLSQISDMTKSKSWIEKHKKSVESSSFEEFGEPDSTGGSSAQTTLGGEGAASQNPSDDEPIVMTYAQVAEKLNRANNMDVLELAGDFIQYVPSIDQRNELSAIFKKRMDEFKEAVFA